MKAYKKFCHWLDMKLNHSTVYKGEDNFTLWNVIYHSYRNLIYPFKVKGWFGYCDECNKFCRNLVKQVIDVDVDSDGEETNTRPVYGMVCKNCNYKLAYEE